MTEEQLTQMLRFAIEEMNRLREENQRLRAALADQQAESVEGAAYDSLGAFAFLWGGESFWRRELL